MRQNNSKALTDADLQRVSGGMPSPSVADRDYLPLYGNAAVNGDADEMAQTESMEF